MIPPVLVRPELARPSGPLEEHGKDDFPDAVPGIVLGAGTAVEPRVFADEKPAKPAQLTPRAAAATRPPTSCPADTVAPDTGGIYPDNDLRTPLAAAKAAISCLRCRDIQLTAEDRGELLATADESLDLLAHLAASLLDVSRLRRPSEHGTVLTCPGHGTVLESIVRAAEDPQIPRTRRAVLRSEERRVGK